jgi:hypothetical protein
MFSGQSRADNQHRGAFASERQPLGPRQTGHITNKHEQLTRRRRRTSLTNGCEKENKNNEVNKRHDEKCAANKEQKSEIARN